MRIYLNLWVLCYIRNTHTRLGRRTLKLPLIESDGWFEFWKRLASKQACTIVSWCMSSWRWSINFNFFFRHQPINKTCLIYHPAGHPAFEFKIRLIFALLIASMKKFFFMLSSRYRFNVPFVALSTLKQAEKKGFMMILWLTCSTPNLTPPPKFIIC